MTYLEFIPKKTQWQTECNINKKRSTGSISMSAPMMAVSYNIRVSYSCNFLQKVNLLITIVTNFPWSEYSEIWQILKL